MSDVQVSAQCANQQAPLCFGAITFFAMDSERCGVCSYTTECSALVAQRIKEVSHVIDVDALLKRHMALKEGAKKPTPTTAKPDSGKLETQDPDARLKTVAKATLKRMVDACGTITELRAALAARQNPLPATLAIERGTIDMLLGGPVHRGELVESLTWTTDPVLAANALFVALTGSKLAVLVDPDTIELK